MYLFPLILISLPIIGAIICIYTDPTGYSNEEVKAMNEKINKRTTPIDRFGPIIQHQVDKGIQELRKQIAADVDRAKKMIETS